MRNPNGYGSVVKLSGNRRNPYGARITLGFKPETGYPIYKFLGYYATRKEAMTALGLYHNNPESVVVVNNTLTPTNKITLQRVYDEWSEEHYQNISKGTVETYVTAFRALANLSERSFESLTINDYEKAFVESGKSKLVLQKAKVVLKQMYIYAFRKSYIPEASIGLPTYISLNGCNEKMYDSLGHRTFTRQEVDKLWEFKDDPDVQKVLFMIYTGLRIREASSLLKEDIHLEERYFPVRKAKTAAGVRDVPINEKIVFIIEKWLKDDNGDERLVPLHPKSEGSRINSKCNGFDKAIEKAGLDRHQIHDTRYTCSTFLTEAGVDDRYVKLIVGHASQDVTNKIYAKKLDIKVLIEAINKM